MARQELAVVEELRMVRDLAEKEGNSDEATALSRTLCEYFVRNALHSYEASDHSRLARHISWLKEDLPRLGLADDADPLGTIIPSEDATVLRPYLDLPDIIEE